MIQNIYAKALLSLSFVALSLSACSRQELEAEAQNDQATKAQPAFTLALDLSGGVSDGVLPVEDIKDQYKALHLNDDELRNANINLVRDEGQRKFVVNLDLSNGSEMDAVVAVCREVQGQAPRYYAGSAKLKITDQAKRTYRIEKKSVDFYDLDGTTASASSIDPQRGQTASYKVKVFLGAKLEQSTKQGQNQSRWLIHYGLDQTKNTFALSEGLSSMNGVVGKIPFVSDWVKVDQGYNNPTGEFGLTNNHYEKLKIPKIVLKPQGSILVFEIENASSVRYNLRKLSVYSQSLTANIVYTLLDRNQGGGKELGFEPAHLYGNGTTTERKNFYTYKDWQRETYWLEPGQTKTYCFWAHALPKSLVDKIDFPVTSIDAKVMTETMVTSGAQGATAQKVKRWYSIPIIRTYEHLTRLSDGKATSTKASLRDNTPIHPVHTFAYRFLWKKGSYDVSVLRLREGNAEAAAYQPWEQINRDYRFNTGKWGEADIVLFTKDQVSAFHKAPHGQHLKTHPTIAYNNSTYPSDEDHFIHADYNAGESSIDYYRVPTQQELAALILVPSTKDYDLTKNNGATKFTETIKVAGQTKTYTTYMKYDQTRKTTYAIKFLEETSNGKYKFTPYTAAYRYYWQGPWGQNWSEGTSGNNYAYVGAGNRKARLRIQVRPLGGLNHQTNTGYQPTHQLISGTSPISKLLAKCINDEWWGNTSPLSADDIVRTYPPIGHWNSTSVYEVGSTLSFWVIDDNNQPLEYWISQDGKMSGSNSGSAWHALIMKANF